MSNDSIHALDARVLLIEDDEDGRLYVARVLEKAGCEVVCANDGESGIREGARGGHDLILADVSMPKVDGIELTLALQAAWKDAGSDPIPIVALTGHTTTALRERCLGAGMSEYVTKPVRPNALIDIVRRWSRREHARVEVPVEIADLVPAYLDRRTSDMSRVREALAGEDFAALRLLGHRMKGTGASYGFPAITDFGSRLEEAASRQDWGGARSAAQDLGNFLKTLRWCVSGS